MFETIIALILFDQVFNFSYSTSKVLLKYKAERCSSHLARVQNHQTQVVH